MIPIYEADRLEDLPLFDRPPQAPFWRTSAPGGMRPCGNTPAGSTAQIWSGLR